MLWWSPPKQRQRWGETDILPSSNWGQIFFDLFYVGGAYNLGHVIKYSSNAQGILYATGAGFPAMMMWFDKLNYDARFTTRPAHDFFHRCLDVVQLCFVATALASIRSSEVLSDPCHHVDMFQFSTSVFLTCMITILRYCEVALFGIGDAAAKVAALRDIRWMTLPTLCLLGAAVESGYYFFAKGRNNNDDDVEHDACLDPNHRPIVWCLASWLTRALLGYGESVLWAPKERRLEMSVPMNIHFCMHRYGEWFMLMFGESIVSLLIVDSDNESTNYAVAFYSGILSVIFLAHLHFRSEPRDDGHALSRSRHSSYLYTVMVPIYSCALIAIGVSYKIFLYDFMYKNKNNNHRLLGGNDDDASNSEEDLEYKRQFTANLFSGSIATVLICTDLLVLLHKGVASILAYARLISKARLTILVLLKYSLVLLLAALSTFQTDPHVMTFCGLGAILAQEFLRNAFFQDRSRPQGASAGGKQDDETVDTFDTEESYASHMFTYHVAKPQGSLAKFEEEEQRRAQAATAYNSHVDSEASTSIRCDDTTVVIKNSSSGVDDDGKAENGLEYSRMAEF